MGYKLRKKYLACENYDNSHEGWLTCKDRCAEVSREIDMYHCELRRQPHHEKMQETLPYIVYNNLKTNLNHDLEISSKQMSTE